MVQTNSKLKCPYCNSYLTDFFRHTTVLTQNKDILNKCEVPNQLKTRTKIERFSSLIGMCYKCLCGITIYTNKEGMSYV